jgi:hypothetical protein
MFRLSPVMRWTPRYSWARQPLNIPRESSRSGTAAKKSSLESKTSSLTQTPIWRSKPASDFSSSQQQKLLSDVVGALRRFRRCNLVPSKRAMKFDMKTQLVPRVASVLGASNPSDSQFSAHELATLLRLLALANVEDGRPIALLYDHLWCLLSRRPSSLSAEARHNVAKGALNQPASSPHPPRPTREALLDPHDVCSLLSSASRIGFMTEDCLTTIVDHDVLRQIGMFTTGHLMELLVSLGRFAIRDDRFDKVAAALQSRKNEITPTLVRPLQAVELLRQLAMARPRFPALVQHLSGKVLAPVALGGGISTRVLQYVCKLLDAMDVRDGGLERQLLKQAARQGVMTSPNGADDEDGDESAFYDVVTADLVKLKHVSPSPER